MPDPTMPDFEELLAAVRADCAARPLAPAAGLRSLGDRRTRHRLVGMAGAVTGVSVVAVAAVAIVVPHHVSGPSPDGNGSLTAAWAATATPTHMPSGFPSVGTPAGDSPTHSSTSSATHGPGDVAPCQPGQMSAVALTGVHTGNRDLVVTLINVGSTSCRVAGFPQLWHTEPGRAPALVPTGTGAGEPSVTLAPRATAQALFSWTDGYGGYASTAPECAHPSHYHDLSFGIGTRKVSISVSGIDVQCGSVSAQWL